MFDALPSDGSEHLSRFVDQFEGAGFDLEAKSLLKPYGAQHAGGVIHKGQGMQNAHQPAFQVVQAAPMVVEVTVMGAVKAQGQGVDGEIAAVQVQLDAAALHSRQGSRDNHRIRCAS